MYSFQIWVWFPLSKYNFNMAQLALTIMQFKCGAPGCDYVTKEVVVEIAWGLLQFLRQDNHLQQEGWGGGDQAPR